MLRRLPISLRFDDDDSEFYEGFIEEKKNNRELSTLILDLLRVYYENEVVREIVENYRIENSPFLKIHAEINRIAMEHSKNTIATNMMGDYTRNEVKKTDNSANNNSQQESPKLIAASEEEMQLRINEGVEKALASILSGNGGHILSEIQNKIGNVALQQEVKPVVEETNKGVEEVKTNQEKETPNIVEAPVVEIPTVEKQTVDEVEKDTVVEEVVEIKPKKPSSFSKLMGSL